MRKQFLRLVLLVMAGVSQAGLGPGGAMLGTSARAETVAVARPVDDTGRVAEPAALERLRADIAAALRAHGIDGPAAATARAAMVLGSSVIQCPGPGHPASLAVVGNDGGCLATVTMTERARGSTLFDGVARTPPGTGTEELARAIAEVAARGLRRPAANAGRAGADITATGQPVRHEGDGRFLVGGRAVDLRAVTYAHDPAVDKDVPRTSNVTLDDADRPGDATRGSARVATITLYQVDPPLTGKPSREAGVDRGTDFRDPSNLVKAAYTNYVSPVLTEDPAPVRVAGHPIGHFFVKVEIPGYPTVLTGMTTIARADTELVDLTIGRQLGIGGVLLTPQPGRLNSAAEVARELALRQRQLRVVDGLYFRAGLGGGNEGPEYLFDDGRVVFLRVSLPVANATDAMAFFAEYIQRGGHNRFGSLLNRPFKGTGAGCSAFAMAWLQAAGAVPFITEPAVQPVPVETERLGARDFWRAFHAGVRIPWRHLGCDERVGAAGVHPARFTIYDLLFHGETPDFIRTASGGLAARIRASYGMVPATLFQLGVLTPIRDLVIDARRLDPDDRGDYSWDGDGVDVAYWDNSRFSAWVRRVWEKGPRDARVSLVREGRFMGLAIDARGAPRQREAFFSAADRRDAAAMAPVESCQAVFARGLE